VPFPSGLFVASREFLGSEIRDPSEVLAGTPGAGHSSGFSQTAPIAGASYVQRSVAIGSDFFAVSCKFLSSEDPGSPEVLGATPIAGASLIFHETSPITVPSDFGPSVPIGSSRFSVSGELPGWDVPGDSPSERPDLAESGSTAVAPAVGSIFGIAAVVTVAVLCFLVRRKRHLVPGRRAEVCLELVEQEPETLMSRTTVSEWPTRVTDDGIDTSLFGAMDE
jgi:hypothetical protein